MTREAKIPVFHIFHNNDIELYTCTVREDKVYLENENVATFSNRGLFTVKDHRGKRLRKYKALFYLDGKTETVHIPESEEQENNFIEPLTNKDRKTIVKREIAKQLGKFRPIETWQFILIIIMLAAILALRFIPI